MEHTTIDILIERLQTHPDEFFKMNWDITELATTNNTRWDLLSKNMMSDAPCFSKEEVRRFCEALRAKIRENVDAEIVRTLMAEPDSDRFNPIERERKVYARQAAAQQNMYQQQLQGLANAVGGIGNAWVANNQGNYIMANQQEQLKKPSLLQRLFNDTI